MVENQVKILGCQTGEPILVTLQTGLLGYLIRLSLAKMANRDKF